MEGDTVGHLGSSPEGTRRLSFSRARQSLTSRSQSCVNNRGYRTYRFWYEYLPLRKVAKELCLCSGVVCLGGWEEVAAGLCFTDSEPKTRSGPKYVSSDYLPVGEALFRRHRDGF